MRFREARPRVPRASAAFGLLAFGALSLTPGTLWAELEAWTSRAGGAGEGQVVALAMSGPLDLSDVESFTIGVGGPTDELPSVLSLESRDASGRALGHLTAPLVSAECPAGGSAGRSCARTLPLFVVPSGSDAAHPFVLGRAVVGRVGGQLLVTADVDSDGGGERSRAGLGSSSARRTISTLGVVGSSGERPLGARLRVHVLAEPGARGKGGALPVLGTSAVEALELARVEVERAGSVLAACGIELAVEELRVVNVPGPRYLTVGCGGAGLASGGDILIGLSRRGAASYRTRAGQTPREVGLGLAELLRSRGLAPSVLENPLAAPDGHRTVDVELGVEISGVRSSDPTLGVCPLVADTGDGVDHFTDGDAGAGTPEERAIVRALADQDRTTIEVIVLGHFAGRGRIGESFIHTAGGTMENTVILDRAGVSAGPQSATLAHELGHVLLQLPGHTDDFGVDTPGALMDSDASDATSAGPRRLSREDCLRALRETGPGSFERLLTPVGSRASDASGVR